VPPHCHVIRDNVVHEVLAEELVPGDLVTFTAGDRIPADVRLIEAVHLHIDESNLTGEQEPSAKHTDPIRLSAVAERSNSAFMGSLVR